MTKNTDETHRLGIKVVAVSLSILCYKDIEVLYCVVCVSTCLDKLCRPSTQIKPPTKLAK